MQARDVHTRVEALLGEPDLRETLSASSRRRLEEYINARGATFNNIEFAERPIEIDLGDGIRVNGRIDLIRRRSTDEIVVIDFKSKSAGLAAIAVSRAILRSLCV